MARDVTSRDCAASARSEQYTPRRSPSRSDGRGTIPRPVSRTLQSPMTTFDDRYRLLKCVALGGGMRTHNAQEKATGRPVMVHIVDDPDPEVVERLRDQVNTLPPAERSRIIEMAATPNGFAVVSEFLPGLTTFPDWVASRAPASAPTPAEPAPADDPAPPPAEPAAAPTDAASRPTGLTSARSEAAASELTQSFVIGRIESTRGGPPKGVQPPGEFTRLFKGAVGGETNGAPVPAAAPPVTPPPPPVAAAPAPAPPKPNVAPVAPPTPPAAASPPPAREAPPLAPGEFTALFRPLGAPLSRDPAPSPLVGGPAVPPGRPAATPFGASPSTAFAAPTPPAREPQSALGRHAAIPDQATPRPFPPPPFGSASPLSTPPASSPASGTSPVGAAPSPLIGGGAMPPLPPVVPPPVFASPGAGASGVPQSPLSGRSAAKAGPSDYTMLIRQSETPAPPAPKASAPTPPTSPTPAKRPIPLGLIIALNVVLVLAIALVLYFVFRPAPPNAEAGGPLPAAANAPAVKAPAVTAPSVKAPALPAVPAKP